MDRGRWCFVCIPNGADWHPCDWAGLSPRGSAPHPPHRQPRWLPPPPALKPGPEEVLPGPSPEEPPHTEVWPRPPDRHTVVLWPEELKINTMQFSISEPHLTPNVFCVPLWTVNLSSLFLEQEARLHWSSLVFIGLHWSSLVYICLYWQFW